MDSEDSKVHILFFPLMAQGHMLPMVDMAKLFAARDVKVTILTTPANASLINPTLNRTDFPIRLHLIPFPSASAGLPEGCENTFSLPSETLVPKFVDAISMFRNPFNYVVKDLRPDCVVTDLFMPWTYDIAAEYGIPRIVFSGGCFFAHCAMDSFRKYKPLESSNLEDAEDSIVLPNLPHLIKMSKSHFPNPNDPRMERSPLSSILEHAMKVESKNYGIVFNSFYDLESDYVEHFRNVVGRKAWDIGPVSLCNKEEFDKLARGGGNNGDELLKWLDGMEIGSVVYICFGSGAQFTASQLREMAIGIEASGHPFIWAVRNAGEDWVPEGFEERIKGKGMVIRGWAPQLLILNHAAVGGFVTHCGWNSCLEAIAAGLPMVTWPLFADQFYNEKLMVDVLKVGVPVGVKDCRMSYEERMVVEAVVVEAAVRRVMEEGEEADGRRMRVRMLGEKARMALEIDGSSYNSMGSLIKEIFDRKFVKSV